MNVQENLLVTLMEECSEVQKLCSKILRAGIHSWNPNEPEPRQSNLQKLAMELNDVQAVVNELMANGLDLYGAGYADADYLAFKHGKLNHFLAISRQLGCLDGPLGQNEQLDTARFGGFNSRRVYSCELCRDTRKVTRPHQTDIGLMNITESCPECFPLTLP